MVNVDLNRSVQFVSLDTHPANNALVVTYEILVVVVDRVTQRELARRNKRSQLLINLSALDKLSEDDLRGEGQLALDLGLLSESIQSKCPILATCRRSNLDEEIRLHLLYLIGRRRSQLLQSNSGSGGTRGSRPTSAALAHLSGTRRSLVSGGSAGQRQRSASQLSHRKLEVVDTSSTGDVYSFLLATESGSSNHQQADKVDKFLALLDDHLSSIEQAQAAGNSTQFEQDDLESLLEGLYGDKGEKLAAMACVRKFEDSRLMSVAGNRLLVCAMLRTLRDDFDVGGDFCLSESILYCLIRMTSFADVYQLAFATGKDPIELMRICGDLLSDHVSKLTADQLSSTSSDKLLSEGYFYTDSLLVIVLNLLRQKPSGSDHKRHQVIANNLTSIRENFVPILVDLLQLVARWLQREIKLLCNPERPLELLNNLVSILRHLSIYKELVVAQFRKRPLVLAETIVSLLTTLQLSRPGSGSGNSGSVQQQQQQQQAAGAKQKQSSNNNNPSSSSMVVADKQTLNALYLLEIDLFRLVNNLLFDQRLRPKFVRKNLLKCVLRNLVVYLASGSSNNTIGKTNKRQLNTLSPYAESSVLLVPFRCLYELSCQPTVRTELFKSKIILKCLLEFLLSASLDLRLELDNKKQSPAADLWPEDPNQQVASVVVVQGSSLNKAATYLLALWANLSACREASIFAAADLELASLLSEYLQLTFANLSLFLSSDGQSEIASTGDQQSAVMVYLHAKLARNFSGQLDSRPLTGSNPRESHPLRSQQHQWANLMAGVCNKLQTTSDLLTPLAVECFAILSNLLPNTEEQLLPLESPLAFVLSRLFQLDCANLLAADNDDLLIVSCLLMVNLARSREICASNSQVEALDAVKIVEASLFVLDTRDTSTDPELICGSLFALSQLMGHCGFLRHLSTSLADVTGESTTGETGKLMARLIDKLASLALDANRLIAKLSLGILNILRLLEQQLSVESFVYKRRFVAYHQKWWSSIGSSGDDDEYENLSEDYAYFREEGEIQPEARDEEDSYASDEAQTRGSGTLFAAGELRNLRSIETRPLSGRESAAAATRTGSRPLRGKQRASDRQVATEMTDEDEDDEDDDADLSAPDLNVIDANSMIKHLTSRRQFRSGVFQD